MGMRSGYHMALRGPTSGVDTVPSWLCCDKRARVSILWVWCAAFSTVHHMTMWSVRASEYAVGEEPGSMTIGMTQQSTPAAAAHDLENTV